MPIHPKVIASVSGSVVAGALTVVIIWLLGFEKITVPPDVANAITVLFSAAICFAAGWITPSPPTPQDPPKSTTPSP